MEPGTQTLTGQQAQIFARARHEYQTDQDAHRQNNVRSLAAAIVEAVLAKPVTELPGTVLTLRGTWARTCGRPTSCLWLSGSPVGRAA